MSHTTPHKIHSAGNTHCQNCNTELKGPFCHACGQHDFDLHRSFGHTFLEALESFLHFDGKILRETTTLLFRPGQLTREFNSGKRASHIPPLRFYIFVSLVFFLWLGTWGTSELEHDKIRGAAKTSKAHIEKNKDKGLDHVIDSGADKIVSQIEKKLGVEDDEDASTNATESGAATPVPSPAITEHVPVAPEPTVTTPKAQETQTKEPSGKKEADFLEEKFEKIASNPEHYREAFLHLVPKMLLVCLPLFALATRTLFRKAGLTYLQHLVASLHLHTFVFLYWMLTTLIEWPFHHIAEGLASIIGFGFAVYWCYYIFKTLRTLFGGSRLRVFVKALLLAMAYGITLAVGFGIIGGLSVAK